MKDFISDAEMNSPEFISDEQMNDEGFMQGLKNAGKAVMYNSNKLGAGMAAGVANVGEALGIDMNASRGAQEFYQGKAKEWDTGDKLVQGLYNPINYTVGGTGAKLAGSILGSSYANEAADSAVTGQDFDVGKANTQAATGAGVMSGLSALGRVPGVMRKAVLGTDGATGQEIKAMQELADKYGLKLTPATTTGSSSLARTEHSLNDSITSKLGMEQAINAEKTGVDNAIVKQLEGMGANGSNINAGETFKQGLGSIIDTEKQYFKQAFSKLFARYGDDPVFSIRGVKAEAQKLVDQAERNPIIKNTTAYRDAKALSNTDDYLTWNDWSQLRTQLGGLTKDSMITGKASTGTYKNLYGKLAEDLKSTVASIGDNATLNEYNKIIQEYKRFKVGLEGKDSGASFMRSINKGTVNPESIGNMINNSTLKANSAMNAGGFDKASGIPLMKKASATDTLLSSRSRGVDNGISMPNFLKATGKDGFQRTTELPNMSVNRNISTSQLLGDDVIPTRQGTPLLTTDKTIISDLRTIASAIAKKDSFKNTSKTAQFNMLNTLKAMNPLQMATFLAKDVGMSLGYRSKLFKSWLDKGAITETQYNNMVNIKNSSNKIKGSGVATNILFNSNNQ